MPKKKKKYKKYSTPNLGKKPAGGQRKKRQKIRPGRPRVIMPFEEAVELIRKENIQSYRDYMLWYDLHHPVRIPRRPDRTYAKDWKGWGYYLGNYNEPVPNHPRNNFRSYEDAKIFAQKLGFSSVTQWHEYCKSGDKPDDIPARPDVHYYKTGDWFSWTEFLGTRIEHRIKSAQEAKQYFYIARYPDVQHPNIYTAGLTSSVINTIRDEKFKVLKIYEYFEDFDWLDLLDTYGERY